MQQYKRGSTPTLWQLVWLQDASHGQRVPLARLPVLARRLDCVCHRQLQLVSQVQVGVGSNPAGGKGGVGRGKVRRQDLSGDGVNPVRQAAKSV